MSVLQKCMRMTNLLTLTYFSALTIFGITVNINIGLAHHIGDKENYTFSKSLYTLGIYFSINWQVHQKPIAKLAPCLRKLLSNMNHIVIFCYRKNISIIINFIKG